MLDLPSVQIPANVSAAAVKFFISSAVMGIGSPAQQALMGGAAALAATSVLEAVKNPFSGCGEVGEFDLNRVMTYLSDPQAFGRDTGSFVECTYRNLSTSGAQVFIYPVLGFAGAYAAARVVNWFFDTSKKSNSLPEATVNMGRNWVVLKLATPYLASAAAFFGS